MANPRIGGPNLGLNLNGAFASQLPLPGGVFTAGAIQASNAITLPAGNVQILPSGTFYVMPGPVTSLQFLDPITQIWRTVNSTPQAGGFAVDSDGGNYRLANLTGCPIGAIITNVGSGYTNGIGTAATGLTITPSTGGSVWVPVVGGVNNSTVTITSGGSSYSFAPTLVCSPPPAGGIPMTATCTVSAGAINAVTVTNQGAGYTAAATITVINDYRDTTGSGAVLTAGALVGSGTLAAMYPSGAQNASFVAGTGGNGTALTAAPTFTFAPASTTAATAVMNMVATGTINITAGGTGVTAGAVAWTGNGSLLPAAAANTAGPISGVGLVTPRLGIIALSVSGGVVQNSNNVIQDPGFGLQTGTNNLLFAMASTLPAGTVAVGGISDTSFVQPF